MAAPSYAHPSHLKSVKTGEISGLEGLLPARLRESKPHLKLVADAGQILHERHAQTVPETVSKAAVVIPPTPQKPASAATRSTERVASRPLSDKVYAYHSVGEALFTKDHNPFDESDDIVLEHYVESRFYDTPDDAMAALRLMVSSTNANFACQIEIVSRQFNIEKFKYRRYAFKARIGLYLNTQWRADRASCDRKLQEIMSTTVPKVQARLERQLSIQSAARELDLTPKKELSQAQLTMMSLAAFGTLCVSFYGVMTGWLA